MVDDFVFTIVGRDEASGCESVTATVVESARSEYTISFNSDTNIEFYEEFVQNALITELSDPTAMCGMKYRLLVKDPSAQAGSEWRLWEDIKKDLKTERGDKLHSEVKFDDATGDISVKFANLDIYNLPRFTNAGVTKIDLKMVAFVAGSTVAGGDQTNFNNLAHIDISFKLLELQAVADCKQNVLTKTDRTTANAFRDLTAIDLPTGGASA
jgi:hypothetical protein